MKTEKKKKAKHPSKISVKFSIGAKLIIIISIIVLLSLGSITTLVSWLVREDLKIQAEDNNFEVNRRSAIEAENTLTNLHSNSLILIQAANALGDSAGKTVELFFEYNPQVAFLLFAVPGKEDELHVNRRFFLSRGIDQTLAESFSENHRALQRRVISGEKLLMNVTPWFKTPMLAFLIPSQGGVLGILFSPEDLSNTFGFGTNQSTLINDSGDILIHADSELVRNAANIGNRDFTKFVLGNSQRNAQTLYTDEEGTVYFGAFTKLNTAGAIVITNIEYDKVFEGINATTRRNIYLTFTVLSICILMIWFFSKSISTPIKSLANAAQKIQGGNFSPDLHNKGMDEIGVLTASFKRMSAALNVFGKFTNREIAVRAMRGEIKPGGMPKNATILFSDMRSFTEKSESFTNAFGKEASNRIVLWLNDYFTRMVECVEKTGGVVDKFIGDGMMAHWGTAYTAGNPQKDALNCVKAALMMRKELFEMNKSRDAKNPGNPPIRIGCGINTGIVTAGQIGSDLRMEYTVIGDPVNLASRTEAQCKPMAADILITEDTWLLVKDYFITEEMDPVSVKGKENPVKTYAIVNFTGSKQGPQTLEDVRKIFNITKPVYQRRMSDTRGPAPAESPATVATTPAAVSSVAPAPASTAAIAKQNLEAEGIFITPPKRAKRKRVISFLRKEKPFG